MVYQSGYMGLVIVFRVVLWVDVLGFPSKVCWFFVFSWIVGFGGGVGLDLQIY